MTEKEAPDIVATDSINSGTEQSKELANDKFDELLPRSKEMAMIIQRIREK